jgi:DNA-binding MarR family transcriptional regulator
LTDHCLTGLADESFSPAIDAIIATNLLYWKIEEQFRQLAGFEVFSKHERHLLVRLEVPKRMGTLAQEMQILPSTLTALATTLEAAGLIARIRDPQDGRAQLLHLTEQGGAARADMIVQAAKLFSTVTGLAPDEIETFAALARKLKKHILLDGVPEGLIR